MDGTIAKINTTLLGWLGYTRDELVGRRRFSDLLTVGGRIYHETHFAPLLSMQGEIGGVALELRAQTATRLPVLVTSVVKTGADGAAATDPHHDLRRPRPPRLRTGTAAGPPGRRSRERERTREQLAATPSAQPAAAARCLPSPGMRPPRTTTRPRPTRSAATSTTCSPARRPMGVLPRRRVRQGRRRRRRHGAGPLHPARRCRLRPRPGCRAGEPQHRPLPGVPRRPTPAIAPSSSASLAPGDRRRRRHHRRRRAPTRPAAARRRHRRVRAHPGRHAGRGTARCAVHQRRTTLRPGDTLLLYTDGLTEARTDGRTRYSDEQLLSSSNPRPGDASALVAALTELLTRLRQRARRRHRTARPGRPRHRRSPAMNTASPPPPQHRDHTGARTHPETRRRAAPDWRIRWKIRGRASTKDGTVQRGRMALLDARVHRTHHIQSDAVRRRYGPPGGAMLDMMTGGTYRRTPCSRDAGQGGGRTPERRRRSPSRPAPAGGARGLGHVHSAGRADPGSALPAQRERDRAQVDALNMARAVRCGPTRAA